MLKRAIILSLCVAVLATLAACKQNTTKESIGSVEVNSAANVQSGTTSGVLLEEDVFDDSGVVSAPSSSDEASVSKPTSSKDQNTSGTSSATVSQNGGEAPSEDPADDTPTQGGNGAVVEQDGTITLPVDWF